MGGLIETRDELIVNTPQKYTALMVSDDKAHYYPDSAWFATKLIADKQMAVAQAAEKFGSGEVTMTSRLTLEIQGVPFANIEPLREYLLNASLEMGGTGSKVRPVVSCKGTTCQYGLIDTFDLSQEIHERFYKGYHEVKLPHKFKIAVGGCPNNCVKPDLNDLGVIGQRIPQIQLDKCRGCKVCQIEETCPIHVAKMEDGKIHIDPEACNHCGRWGKKVAQGRYLDKVFTDRQEVLDVIEKAILLFREQENLAAQKRMKGGATC